MDARTRFGWGVLAAMAVGGRLLTAQNLDRSQALRNEETLRLEGQAVVALADAAADGEAVPSDFALDWHNDFLKAQPGTFVPFIVRIVPPAVKVPAALLYVRAAHRRSRDAEATRTPRRRPADMPEVVFHPFEEIYPIELPADRGQPIRIMRGFSLPPGEYDLTVVVRERERENERRERRLAGVLQRPLNVPDFGSTQLTTSTIILADRLTVLPDSPPASQLFERPYVIGGRDIQPAADSEFKPREELIVVFLVYNPAVTPDKHFDLEVEYHFFRKTGAGEAYFNRTEPQRFNPAILGARFDPSAGQPVLAGQGVPLAGFQEGEYRLSIQIRDHVSGQLVERQVRFTVRS